MHNKLLLFFYISLHVYILFYNLNKDIIITIIIIDPEQHDVKILKLKHRFSCIIETGGASVYTYEYMFIIAFLIFTFKFILVPHHIALLILTFKFIRMPLHKIYTIKIVNNPIQTSITLTNSNNLYSY